MTPSALLRGEPEDAIFDMAMGIQSIEDNQYALKRLPSKDNMGKAIAEAVAIGTKAGKA